MKTICIDLVQKSELKNKEWFTGMIRNLDQEQFEQFCKEIMHLNEHYATTVGLYATDQYSVYAGNEKLMWQIDAINFEGEVNFKQIS